MDRRQFITAVALMCAAAITWDVGVNGGKPASADDEQEPP